MKLTPQEIQKIQTFFRDKPVKKVYLFGSFARGEADENSDVDLLIDWDYNHHIGLNYIKWLFDVKEILGKEVDFVSWEFISPLIEKYIQNDKVLIYEA
ncbi:nucleotidyltransferase family protein [Chryseobacterium taklimakanense]|uniref:Nucleotidyltransferase n=1 Tax=Chryseobacterium taklimakanense TaxID=536441 RepID=A0A239XWF6_9FLAO|nr:nucleotidyltransferase domain-containing protein [Chryseobacterium taklimakanense]AZI20905.1 nucleotidyltransferase [Chryseobacterium taklimakanense]SNV50354.1 Predicted nucleotidyltransferases [Chryseobacterium taklimakanense]